MVNETPRLTCQGVAAGGGAGMNAHVSPAQALVMSAWSTKQTLAQKLTKMTPERSKYPGIGRAGPFKPEHYPD
jgi:hypothetical protein